MDTKELKPIFAKGFKTQIRPLSRADIPQVTMWINDGEITQFLTVNRPMMQEQEESWYESLLTSKDDIVFAIETHEGEFIGLIGIHSINYINRTATTGAYIGKKKYWSKGYGTDAKMLVLKYAFDTLGMRKMESTVISYNKRSLQYSLNCGYIEEGRKRKHIFKNGKYWDLIILGLFRNEWWPIYKKYKRTRSLK